MTVAVLGTSAFIVIMFICVIVGKSIDKREEELIGKDEIKDQKEKA